MAEKMLAENEQEMKVLAGFRALRTGRKARALRLLEKSLSVQNMIDEWRAEGKDPVTEICTKHPDIFGVDLDPCSREVMMEFVE